MRIAQVAPLMESVPPKLYGGTERVVSYLTEELAALGHDVTLFASGDAVTRAALDPVRPHAIRLDPACRDPSGVAHLDAGARRSPGIRVRRHPFPHGLAAHAALLTTCRAVLTTLHGRLDHPESRAMLREFGRTPLVSISDAQRQPAPAANWLATVHHGLPSALLAAKPGPADGYLAFLGRISPEKQADAAIRIALASGRRIRIAAKIDPADTEYFQSRYDPCSALPASSSWARSPRRKRQSSSATRPRSCSRSRGPSRSAWS